jgi:peptidoglycan hydrolase CwlO-like protein
MRLEISTLSNKVSNQLKNDFMEQISEKESQLSRLNFQIQSLQNSYNNIQEELNQTEARERKAQQELMYVKNQLLRT